MDCGLGCDAVAAFCFGVTRQVIYVTSIDSNGVPYSPLRRSPDCISGLLGGLSQTGAQRQHRQALPIANDEGIHRLHISFLSDVRCP